MKSRGARITSLVIALWLAPFAVRSHAGEVYWADAAVNTRLVKSGQPFRFVLTAGAQQGWARLPGRAGIFPECLVLSYKEKNVSKRHEGYLAQQGIYRLAAFSLDEIILPPQTVHFSWADGNTALAQTLPIRIGIHSLQPEPGFSLIDPRPPRRASNIMIIVFIAALWLVLSVWIVRVLQRRPRARPPAPPPHLQAMKSLEELGSSRLVAEATESDMYFTVLSRIMRQYIASRYNFPALELSRIAIVEELMRQGAEARHRELINKLLMQTDLVKFAQEAVDYRQVAEAHGLAKEIIALTRSEEETPAGKAPLR